MQLILLAAVVAVSQAVVLPGGVVGGVVPGYGYGGIGVARVGVPAIAKVAAPIDEYDPNPQYSYSYDIAVSVLGNISALGARSEFVLTDAPLRDPFRMR